MNIKSLREKAHKKSINFWMSYWSSLNCMFTGALMGFGLSGIDIKFMMPYLLSLWGIFALFICIFYEPEGLKNNRSSKK